jgi:hypothetical protein
MTKPELRHCLQAFAQLRTKENISQKRKKRKRKHKLTKIRGPDGDRSVKQGKFGGKHV